MKKGKLLATLLCSASMVMGSMVPTVPAMADAMKVVTLGADLSDEQKNTMLKYFKVDSSQVQIIYVTNQDERDHLSSYVPLEQIGTRTVSCAYVKPTTSGGIKVRTANLNWVTCNMIASSLSTSGVTNCEVVAACPFEVSGTGALTGIQMAYETASGQKLDETKKELATEEMVVTGNRNPGTDSGTAGGFHGWGRYDAHRSYAQSLLLQPGKRSAEILPEYASHRRRLLHKMQNLYLSGRSLPLSGPGLFLYGSLWNAGHAGLSGKPP